MSLGGLGWLSDYIIGALNSPTWVLPIAHFVDERCITFEDTEENQLEHTVYHDEYRQLIDALFVQHLAEVALSFEEFEAFCTHGMSAKEELHKVLVEQLLSVDDFLAFKAMMAKRNVDLDRQASLMLSGLEPQSSADLGSGIASLAHSSGSVQFLQWPFFEGVLAWQDCDFRYIDVPAELRDSTLFAGLHQDVPSGILTFSTTHTVVVYIFFEGSGPRRDGGLGEWFSVNHDWVEVYSTPMSWSPNIGAFPHEHPLTLTSLSTPWMCDCCDAQGNQSGIQRFRCVQGCDFDLCQNCHNPEKFSVSIWSRRLAAGDSIVVPIQQPWIGGVACKPCHEQPQIYENQQDVSDPPSSSQRLSAPSELPPVIPRRVRMNPIISPASPSDQSPPSQNAPEQSNEHGPQVHMQQPVAQRYHPTAEELQRRTEHLKRQRDLLVQRRAAERESQLRTYHQSRDAASSDVVDTRASVETTEVAASNATQQDAALRIRQALTLQLRQTLTSKDGHML